MEIAKKNFHAYAHCSYSIEYSIYPFASIIYLQHIVRILESIVKFCWKFLCAGLPLPPLLEHLYSKKKLSFFISFVNFEGAYFGDYFCCNCFVKTNPEKEMFRNAYVKKKNGVVGHPCVTFNLCLKPLNFLHKCLLIHKYSWSCRAIVSKRYTEPKHELSITTDHFKHFIFQGDRKCYFYSIYSFPLFALINIHGKF